MTPKATTLEGTPPHALRIVGRVVVHVGIRVGAVSEEVVNANAVAPPVRRHVQTWPSVGVWVFPSSIWQFSYNEICKFFVDAAQHVVDFHQKVIRVQAPTCFVLSDSLFLEFSQNSKFSFHKRGTKLSPRFSLVVGACGTMRFLVG